MKNTTVSMLRSEYSAKLYTKIQALTSLRQSKMTQQQIADLLGVSLSKIQRFERYDCEDCYLLWGYKKLLK